MSDCEGSCDLNGVPEDVVEIKRGCDTCPFRGKKIGPKGNPKARIVIVGESPGAEELAKGMPFMGPSGKLLDSSMPPDVDIFYTNALSCLPVKKDPKILANAVMQCRSRLIGQISEHPRDVIIALGNGALWALTGDYNLKITQERGKVFPSELAIHGIVASVHPAFLLRGGGSFKKFKEDLQYAVALVEGRQTKQYIEPEVIIITPDMVDGLKAEMRKQEYIAGDIETSGLRARRDRMISTGFCWEPTKAYIAPPELIHAFKDEFENPDIKWIWHNGKFDISFKRIAGINARVDEDTMLLSYALDETRGVHDLDQVAKDALGAPNHKHVISDWFDKNMPHLKKDDRSYDKLPFDFLANYQGKDLSKTLQIFQMYRPRVAADPQLEKLYTKTFIPVSELLYHIELRGFMFDWTFWQEAKDRLEAEIADLQKQAEEIVGSYINLNSPAQVATFAYDVLKIRAKSRSTAKEVVALWPNIPFKKVLKEYRTASKALSTYVVGMSDHIHEDDGRIHPTFLIHGTRTGRLACRNPNLQNIPRDARLRGMFKAAPGMILVDLDASQAEMRSLAIQSGDPTMIAILSDPKRSLHKETAVYRFGPDYTEEQYVRAKAVNFGIIYGRTAYTLAEEFGITQKQAQAEIDSFWKQFPVAKEFTDKCRNAPLKRQTLVTIFGRKCRPGIVSRENMNAVQNEFANFPHQSTASDITLHVAMAIRDDLGKLGAGIVDLVHDSIVVECRDNPEDIAAVQKLGAETFPRIAIEWGMTKVPFKSEAKLNYNWGNPIKKTA